MSWNNSVLEKEKHHLQHVVSHGNLHIQWPRQEKTPLIPSHILKSLKLEQKHAQTICKLIDVFISGLMDPQNLLTFCSY
jgi:hypothetical protein